MAKPQSKSTTATTVKKTRSTKKSTLTKPKLASDPTKKGESSLTQTSALQRHHMIAEAAYFMAEARGFAPGSETDDWLAAESAINAATAQQGH